MARVLRSKRGYAYRHPRTGKMVRVGSTRQRYHRRDWSQSSGGNVAHAMTLAVRAIGRSSIRQCRRAEQMAQARWRQSSIRKFAHARAGDLRQRVIASAPFQRAVRARADLRARHSDFKHRVAVSEGRIPVMAGAPPLPAGAISMRPNSPASKATSAKGTRMRASSVPNDDLIEPRKSSTQPAETRRRLRVRFDSPGGRDAGGLYRTGEVLDPATGEVLSFRAFDNGEAAPLRFTALCQRPDGEALPPALLRELGQLAFADSPTSRS